MKIGVKIRKKVGTSPIFRELIHLKESF